MGFNSGFKGLISGYTTMCGYSGGTRARLTAVGGMSPTAVRQDLVPPEYPHIVV